jgi:hypothetical protein
MAQKPDNFEEEPEYDPDDDTEQSGILSVAMETKRTPDLIPSPAPRKVPIALQARLYFGSSVIQGAWVFLAVSMIFVWYWLPNTDLTSWYRFGANVKTTYVSSEVKRVEQVTGFKTKREGAILDLSRVTYSYSGAKGTPEEKNTYEAIAYTPDPYTKGDVKTIEYLPNAPHIARFPDSLQKPYGPAKAIIALIPLLCLTVILIHMLAAFKHLRLLSHGTIALSTVKHTEKAINKQTKALQHRYTVQFIAADGKRYKSRCFSDRAHVANPDALPVLYRTKNPGRSAAMLDSLPGHPTLTSDGKFKDPGNGIYYLIIPLLTFLLNLAAGIWAMNQ